MAMTNKEERTFYGFGRPVSVVRAELLADPETKEIAKTLGVDLEAYVDLVLDYAMHPEKEPVLEVADEEELLATGADIPLEDEIEACVDNVIARLTTVDRRSKEQDAKVELRLIAGTLSKNAPGVGAERGQIKVERTEKGDALKDQIIAARKFAVR
jgi:hypothetical protein